MRTMGFALLGAVALTGAAGADDGFTTLAISGPPDAVVRYDCDFPQGGGVDGQVAPPHRERWPVAGAECRFEQISGPSGVEIRMRADGNVSRVRTGGVGSRISLSIGGRP